MIQLKLPSFTNEDFELLEDYVEILTPIAIGLDYLQKEENCFYGMFLPTLVAIEKKLLLINRDKLFYSQSTLDAVLQGFRSRFCKYLELEDMAFYI